ncbi:SDR family oxidoreductase [Alkalicoccus daliensis]|uniref:NAD(P)H dehydrogenase (Quinone) n=1 Tax=Alkalicoccus daliensis TaxID=745820 RepID=A0A1H0JZQ7_9BACI|nr:SDR family oxidoreductase [Alkalicoccus daliensis]SDO49176.1 NAD(P)H dehydrogenase (quinone) [Alkalicoccus daliensis]
MKILVTGATGNLGSKIVQKLLGKISAEELAVSVRNPETAEGLGKQGVEVRYGDFDYPDTLDKAFAGVNRLLIISTDGANEVRIKQHTNAVAAAKRAGVSFIAYTSIANAQESTNNMAPPHKATEQAIKESGIPYAFLRNNWYLENEAGSIQGAMAGAPWVTAAEDGKVGWALQEDYAAAAANVLTEEGHENKTYELSGPLYTQEALVKALEQVLDQHISLEKVEGETYAKVMKDAGLPEGIIPIVAAIQRDIRNGTLAVENSDFEKVIGRPVTPLKDALSKLVRELEENK